MPKCIAHVVYSDQRRYLNIKLAFLSSGLTPNGHENKAEALHAQPTLYGQIIKGSPSDNNPQICRALRVSSLQRRCILNSTPRHSNFPCRSFEMMRKTGETVIGFKTDARCKRRSPAPVSHIATSGASPLARAWITRMWLCRFHREA